MLREHKKILKSYSLVEYLKANGYKEINNNYDGDYTHTWKRDNHFREINEWEGNNE